MPPVMVLMAMLVMLVAMRRSRLSQLHPIHHMNLRGRNARPVHLLDRQPRAKIERGGGVLENPGIEPNIQQSTQQHVSADAGEAIKVGDSHEGIVSRVTEEKYCRQR